MVTFDEVFLLMAIKKAWEVQTFALPNPSVGALILNNNQIIALEAHNRFGSFHAELKACKEAFLVLSNAQDSQRAYLDGLSAWNLYEFLAHNHQNLFKDCTIYTTLEPCNHEGKTPSCAKLLSFLKPKRVVFGSRDLTPKAQGGADFLKAQGIEIQGEICPKESLDLLYPFLCFNQKKRFNLFKIAQRLNGNYKQGQISNQASRIFTHTQRSNADSLIVSGQTIRIDKPKLDTRFSLEKNKTPKIQILSKKPTPTHSICAKEVKIYNEVSHLKLNEGFNIIEGGYPLLMSLKDDIDCLLLIFAPWFEGDNPTQITEMKFDLLHSQAFGNQDIALWLKPQN